MSMPRPQRNAIGRILLNASETSARTAVLGLGLCCLHCSSEGTKKAVTTHITDDGDSGKSTGKGTGPVVIDGVRCGGMLDDKLASPYTMISSRKVFVDYPCDLEAGSPVTFVLNLHGTQSVEDGKHYIREYNKLGENAQKYNFVVATPIAIGSQWGNGDNGQDAPYLAATVDWVYSSFAGYDIKQMWVTGHSWGAAYSLSFVCKPEYEDKIRGLLFMSGGANLPACADRLSIIATVGETDIVPGQPEQTMIAAGHGCDARSERTMGQDNVSEWANCDRGWVHQDYLMLGKGHGFDPKDWPDADMTTAIAEAIHATQPE
jgi:poly(3-hydroxybutyrate) depolymerase